MVALYVVRKDFMTFFVRRCLLLFIVGELFVFFMLYCFGPKGLKTFYDISSMQSQTRSDILTLQQEIAALKQEIVLNQTDFAKEKIARERLLMKKDGETVYFKTTMR